MSQAISFLFLILSFGFNANAEPLQDALNGMQVMMNGQPTFNPEFYNELVTCMNSLDSRLLTSVGSQWDGMIQYANAGGNPEANDTWPACTARGKWFEFNCTTQEYGNMPIFEPCNYASNIAYYHTVTEICGRQDWNVPDEQVTAMASTFAILGQGSAFWHGSETNNGGSADVRINDLFAYVAYQAAMEGLGVNDNPVITHLANYSRPETAAEITSNFIDMYIEVPVEEWGTLLDETDFPDLRLIMCGYFSTVLTLLYPEDTVDGLVDYLLEAFNQDGSITPDITEFCLGEFIPEVRLATQSFNLTSEEFLRLEGNLFSTFTKLVYSFLWQEQVLTQDDTWLQPTTNELGMIFLPIVNAIGNNFNSWNYSDPLMQSGINMYPGEEWCNLVIPHAKWHLETSIALTDFTFLSDELYRIFKTYV